MKQSNHKPSSSDSSFEFSQDYDYEIPRVLKKIKEMEVERVGLQFPEGLKKDAVSIAARIEEKANVTTIIFIGPFYGACDLKEEKAKELGIDLLVHFGHTKFGFEDERV